MLQSQEKMPDRQLDCFEKRSNTRAVDKLRAMETFVRIVEAGSLTALNNVIL